MRSSRKIIVYLIVGGLFCWSTFFVRGLGDGTSKGKCPKHFLILEKDMVPIAAGLLSDEGYELLEKREKMFPNANTFVYTGCVADGNKSQVLFCKLCRKEAIEWDKELEAHKYDDRKQGLN